MNSNKSWELEVKSRVSRTLKKFPADERRRILGVIENLPNDPYFGDIEKMEDQDNSWRHRIGAYRIFYEVLVPEKIILVFRIERRTSSTY